MDVRGGHRMIFSRKNQNGLIRLRYGTSDDFKNCPHVLNAHAYGAHPTRNYVSCVKCGIIARLDWKDPYARLMNRVFFGIPFFFTAFVAIGTIVAIVLIYF